MDDKEKLILIVDDEEHTRLGYAEVLRLDGYDVDVAEDGDVGFRKALANEYDVIVTDLRMPKSDGISFVQRLREKGINTPVIVITAFGSYKTYKSSKNLGVIEYLNKPIRAKDLKSAIEKVLS
ncbi:MAG: response regulator [Deferribacterota bacterium]|nr:response regulator [Deferribacterota bacterium]